MLTALSNLFNHPQRYHARQYIGYEGSRYQQQGDEQPLEGRCTSQQHAGIEHRHDHADTQGLIHYGYSASSIQFHQEYNLFYDAGDFFRSQLPESDYQQWKQALDEAVVEKRFAKEWRTCMTWRYIYSDFEMTEEKYHGVSMYIPQDPNTEYGKYYARNNEDIKQLKWYQSVW